MTRCQAHRVDDVRLAGAVRAARVRRGLRQEDLAARAAVSRSLVSRIERGRLAVPIGRLASVARALELQMDVSLRWRGRELDRLVDAGHAAMHDELGRRLDRAPGWERSAEVSFSIFGERGVIDVLGWHPASRTMLVIELKTLLVDVSDLLGTMDRRRRLARRSASERGWSATSVATWVVFGESATDRRRVECHRPAQGRGPPPDASSRVPSVGRRDASVAPRAHRSHRRALVPLIRSPRAHCGRSAAGPGPIRRSYAHS
jgi:transcriptional regulator with XRE-family HTH domain